jgi:hypothetical protein
MNILILYNQTQTYTNTVFEHINSFSRYSQFDYYYSHHDQYSPLGVDLSRFEVICLHYSVRLPYDQIADSTADELASYQGLTVLFIQDEYDHTHRAWDWIRRLGIQLVFTVVPPEGVSHVYPPQEFPGVRFVSVLTGYVPDDLHKGEFQPPSQRQLFVGYRGRPLHIRYGQLGLEKIEIGRLVKKYCESKGIQSDIEWTEKARIYGPKWYEFMTACRSMLGSESGSNVFDRDGTLATKIQEFRAINPHATDNDVYATLIQPHEVAGLMNQVSPRIFEAIASRTVLVLFEGSYSSVVTPGVHFISLKKDGSNLDEVFRLLADGSYVDAMAERAYKDVIASGKYSYQSFIRLVDQEIEYSLKVMGQHKTGIIPNCRTIGYITQPTPITTSPIRSMPEQPTNQTLWLLYRIWLRLPEAVRIFLKPRLKWLLGKG